jgi:hypothetical protein
MILLGYFTTGAVQKLRKRRRRSQAGLIYISALDRGRDVIYIQLYSFWRDKISMKSFPSKTQEREET